MTMTVFSNLCGTGEYGRNNNVRVDKRSFMVKTYDPNYQNSDNNGIDIGYFMVSKCLIPSQAPIDLSFQNDILVPLCIYYIHRCTIFTLESS